MADKPIHPNIRAMQQLHETYGYDALVEATGYTFSTLAQYLRPKGKVIPDKKLKIVRIFLEAQHQK